MKNLKNSRNVNDFSLPSFGGFLQIDVKAGDPAGNLDKVSDMLTKLSPPKGAMVVLPELWSAGFLYAELDRQAEQTENLLAEMTALADRFQICLAGSLPEKVAGEGEILYHNTLYFCGPDGLLGSYRKQQLFGPMEEDLR